MLELKLELEQVQELAKVAGVKDVDTLLKKGDGSLYEAPEVTAKVVELIQNRFTQIDSENQKRKEEIRGEAWRDSRVEIEKAIKKELGIPDFSLKETPAAIATLKQRMEAAQKIEPDALTLEKLEKLPIYSEQVHKIKSSIEQEWREKFTALESKVTNDQKRNIIRQRLSKLIQEKNGNTPKSGLETAIDFFIHSTGGLDSFDLKDDDIIPIDIKDGQRVVKKDKNHLPQSFEDYAYSVYDSLFGFNAAPPSGGGGVKPNLNGGSATPTYNITSRQQLQEMIAADPSKANEYMTAYSAHLKKKT